MSDKAKSRLMIAGAALCAALFLFSGAMLCREYLDQKQSAEAFDEVAGLVKEDVELPTLELAGEPDQEPEELTAFEKYADVYAQNSDLVGWISIPGTRIDYPVMQTKDNPNFYLKHAFDKSYSSYGVPYMQENCDVGISDNLVLYGHHMNNGSMFSDLCKYESEDFYQEHKTIRFDTLDSFGEYEVIAAFKTVAYSEEGFKYYHFVNGLNALSATLVLMPLPMGFTSFPGRARPYSPSSFATTTIRPFVREYSQVDRVMSWSPYSAVTPVS